MRYTIPFALLCIFLVACGGGGSSYTTDFHTGTQGITIRFLENYPETQIYEEVNFPVVVLVENLGAVTVPPNRTWVSFSFDQLYFTFDFPTTITLDRTLNGKSELYPQGEQTQLEFFDAQTNKLIGQRQQPTTAFSALVCYEYMTELSQEVCVDVDKYLRTGREQVCTGKDITSRGQGAPIAFTDIVVRTLPVQTGTTMPIVKPSFEVTVQNLGGGIVAGPPKENLKEVCQLKNLEREELGAVYVNGSIFNIPLECSPSLVSLKDGQGKTLCTIGDGHLNNPAFSRQQNIMAVLNLEARYIYRNAVSQEMTILKREGYDSFEDLEYNQRVRGYAYYDNGDLKEENGEPMTVCRDYARSGTNGVGSDWDCACRTNECANIDGAGFCSFGLCPGDRQCCDRGGYDIYVALQEENSKQPPRDVRTGDSVE